MNDETYRRKLISLPEQYRAYAYRADTGLILNARHTMTNAQHLGVLRRLRRIVEASPLVAEDCDDIGFKRTDATWGLCNDSPELYPTADLHIWPDMFDRDGRVAPIDSPRACPMRADTKDDPDREHASGCFYDCRIFQRKHKTPARDEALRLIDADIALAEVCQ